MTLYCDYKSILIKTNLHRDRTASPDDKALGAHGEGVASPLAPSQEAETSAERRAESTSDSNNEEGTQELSPSCRPADEARKGDWGDDDNDKDSTYAPRGLRKGQGDQGRSTAKGKGNVKPAPMQNGGTSSFGFSLAAPTLGNNFACASSKEVAHGPASANHGSMFVAPSIVSRDLEASVSDAREDIVPSSFTSKAPIALGPASAGRAPTFAAPFVSRNLETLALHATEGNVSPSPAFTGFAPASILGLALLVISVIILHHKGTLRHSQLATIRIALLSYHLAVVPLTSAFVGSCGTSQALAGSGSLNVGYPTSALGLASVRFCRAIMSTTSVEVTGTQ